MCDFEEPVAPPQPSLPVAPPRRITISPASGHSLLTFFAGAAPTTAPAPIPEIPATAIPEIMKTPAAAPRLRKMAPEMITPAPMKITAEAATKTTITTTAIQAIMHPAPVQPGLSPAATPT